jgi:hypothetical protein
VALEFEQIGVGDRIRIVADLGLGIVGAASMRPEQLIRTVSQAVVERALTTEFFEAVHRVRS